MHDENDGVYSRFGSSNMGFLKATLTQLKSSLSIGGASSKGHNKCNLYYCLLIHSNTHISVAKFERPTRFLWLFNFEPIPNKISLITNGRVRMTSNNLIISQVQLKDAGMYTCYWLRSKDHHPKVYHFNLSVVPYGNTWFDMRNPACIFKCSVILVSVTFATVLVYVYLTHTAQTELNLMPESNTSWMSAESDHKDTKQKQETPVDDDDDPWASMNVTHKRTGSQFSAWWSKN